MVSRPVSGILSYHRSGAGDHPSDAVYPRVANLAAGGRAAHALCLTLLRVGFTEPCKLPYTLVRSYRTVAPLPVTSVLAHRRSLSVALPSGRPNLAHASTLPCGVPTFLDTIKPCRGHPADSPSPSIRARLDQRPGLGAGGERIGERVEAGRLEVDFQAHAVFVAVATDEHGGRK